MFNTSLVSVPLKALIMKAAIPLISLVTFLSIFQVKCNDSIGPLASRIEDLSDDIVKLKRDLLRVEEQVSDRIEVAKISLTSELMVHIKEHVGDAVADVLEEESVEVIVRDHVLSEVRQLKKGFHVMKGQIAEILKSLQDVQVDALNKGGRGSSELKCVLVEQSPVVDMKSSALELLVRNTSWELEWVRKELATVEASLQKAVSELTSLKRTLNATEKDLAAKLSNLTTLVERSIKPEDKTTDARYICEENWIRHGTSCYLFVGNKESWMAASQICETRGGALLSVETEEESTFIRGYLKVFAGLGADMKTWIGGTDIEKEGIWKWSPSGNLMTYTDWFPGQPERPDGGDCAIIWPGHAFHWGDIGCTYLESSICEKPASEIGSKTSGFICEDNWFWHGTSCYFFFGNKRTWVEASQICASRGGALAAVETAEESVFLRGYLKVFAALGGDMKTWIGGTDMEIEGIWKWSPSGKQMTFNDWFPSQPEFPDGGDCAIIWPGHAFHWGDIRCSYLASFICEKKATKAPLTV